MNGVMASLAVFFLNSENHIRHLRFFNVPCFVLKIVVYFWKKELFFIQLMLPVYQFVPN